MTAHLPVDARARASRNAGQLVSLCDDAPIARMAWPQLTTVHQPNAERAAATVDLLLGAPPRAGQDGSGCVEFGHTLVDRSSSGLRRSSDGHG